MILYNQLIFLAIVLLNKFIAAHYASDVTAGIYNREELVNRKKITESLSKHSNNVDSFNNEFNRDSFDSLHESDINSIINSIDLSKYFTLADIRSWKQERRIRREVRDIPYSQWLKIADAINVMKFTDQITGVSKYGDKFYNYDYLSCFHGHASLTPLGDQGHFTQAFTPWHRAFLLMIEESVLAIDPTIEALPYWDYRRDLDDPLHSIVLT